MRRTTAEAAELFSTVVTNERFQPGLHREALDMFLERVLPMPWISGNRGDFLKALKHTSDGGSYYPDAVGDAARGKRQLTTA